MPNPIRSSVVGELKFPPNRADGGWFWPYCATDRFSNLPICRPLGTPVFGSCNFPTDCVARTDCVKNVCTSIYDDDHPCPATVDGGTAA